MRVDRTATAIAFALCAGGWLCHDNDGDSCPGALECAVDVANVCCPFGQPYACDGACIADPNECVEGTNYACTDNAPTSSCAFSATIATASCGDPIANINWHVQASGTVTGCGDDGIYIARPDGRAFGHLDCGSWAPGMFATSCLPDADASTTTWSIDDVVFPLEAGNRIELTVRTGSGAVLATLQATCLPPPGS